MIRIRFTLFIQKINNSNVIYQEASLKILTSQKI